MSDAKGRFWLCQKCGKHVPARQTECRCGFSRAGLAEVDFAPVGGAMPLAQAGPSWFAVGPAKLVVMSVLTLGFYQIYWFYQQWRRVRDSGEDVWPLPRSIFGVIFCYPLFQRVFQSARDVVAPAAGPGSLAVAYVLLCISWKLPTPLDLISLLSVLPLTAVQRVANAVARRDFPQADPNSRLTPANWIGVALGGALLILVAYGAFFREKPTSLAFLTKVAAEVNSTRREPKDGVQLEKAVALEGTLVYYFSVTDDTRDLIQERKGTLKQRMMSSLCRDRLLKMGVAVRFVYTDQNGEEVATVDVAPQDCDS